MAQTIKLKRSATQGGTPTTSQLALGEVAINTYDGTMFIKKDDGSESIIQIGGVNDSAIWNSYAYTATSSQTSFSGADDNSDSLSYVTGFVQVFLNGILLDPTLDYAATTGSSIVLTSGASTGDLLQVETFTQVIGTGDILVDTFLVSTTQTAFTLSQDPVSKNNISVYVGGVYQESSTYSLSTTTLTLSQSPSNGTTVEVVIGTRNVTLDDIADFTISGTLYAGALDPANVTAAGALMDSELTSITDVKALNQSVVSGATPNLGVANMTIDDTNLVVADTTNMQSFVDLVDDALLKARGTGVTSNYTSTVVVGGTTFAQPAVKGEIYSDQGYFAIEYTGATGVTVANLTAPNTYVYIDNTSSLGQQTSIPTREDWSRKMFTMRIAVDTVAEDILGFEYLSNPIGHYTNTIRDIYEYLLAQGIPFKKDQTITGRSTDLGFDISAGTLLELGGTGNTYNPNIKQLDAVDNVEFFLSTRTAFDAGGNTDLPKFWDNNGTLTALGSTTLVAHRIYRFSNGNVCLQYGQGNYANMTLAKTGAALEDYVLNPALENATFFGWWFIESTATNTGGTTLTSFVEYTIGIQGGSSSGLSGALLKGNNLSDLLDAGAARTNLGLGTTDSPTFDGLTVDGNTDDAPIALLRADNTGIENKNTLRFEDTDTSTQNDQQLGRIEFYSNDSDHTGIDAVIEAVSATTALKELRFLTSEDANTPLSRFAIARNGDVSFYEDTGTTAKMVWDASAEALSIGTSTAVTDRRFQVTGSNTGLSATATQFGIVNNPTFTNTITNNIFNLYTGPNISSGATLGNLYNLYLESNNFTGSTVTNSFGLYQAGVNDKNYFAGNVGIGEQSPDQKLHVSQAVNNGLATIKIENTFGSLTAVGTGTSLQFSGWDAGVTANIKSIRTGSSYSPSALTFETFGGAGTTGSNTLAERMRIDEFGNVGIGISPSKKLTVFGTGAGNATVQIEGEGGADPYINFLANNTQHWSLGIDDSDADKFKLSEHSALGTNDYFVVDVTGNVGIGTASPSQNLHIADGTNVVLLLEAGNTSGSYINFADTDDTNIGQIFYDHSSDTMALRANNANRLYLDSTGATVAGKLSVANDIIQITSTSPEILFSVPNGGLDSRIFNDGSGNFIFGNGANSSTPTEAMRLTANNDMVIGSQTNPDSRKLRVYGISEIDGAGVGLLKFKSSGTEIGSVGQGNYVVSGGPAAGFGLQSTTDLVFGSGGTTRRMTIDTSGHVGIAETDPNGYWSQANQLVIAEGNCGLTLKSAAAGNGRLVFTDTKSTTAGLNDGGMISYNHTDDTMIVQTAGTEAMRIDSAGTVDITNDVLANNAKLKAIATSNTDTAVDVFVYDTRKDSDGGAWRKRTQHTSWYNEALNTSTRGARKEFPSVAVIVAEASALTIYDGDDPDMPMWMVFNASGGLIGGDMLPADDLTSTTALNAVLCYGMASSASRNGLGRIDLIKETRIHAKGNNVYYYLGNIAERSGGKSNTLVQNGPDSIVGTDVNDIAMTVLPNAPIDADTGLPVPTIAVATDGGVSVIKDDGTIHNLTGGAIETISINDRQEFITTPTNSSDTMLIKPLNTTDANLDWNTGLRGYSWNPGTGLYPFLSFRQANTVVTPEGFNFSRNAGVGGMTLMSEDFTNARKTLQAIISSDFNTGYQVGDIKLATLSDTDTTNANPAELITNGTFDSNITGWSSQLAAVLTNPSGRLSIESTGSNSMAYQYFTGSVAESFIVTVNLISGAGYIGTGGSTHALSTTGVNTFVLKAGRSNSKLDVSPNSNTTMVVDSISVKRAEQDRSVNGKGLQVFGTITKTAVATGADLVAYSGFSSSNYLKQPYNADLQFGTGDFSSTWWFKSGADNGTYQWLFERQAGELEAFVFSGTGILRVYVGGNAIETGQSVFTGAWHQLCFVRRSGVGFLYLDGQLKSSTAMTGDMSTTNSAPLTVGARNDGALPSTGHSLALLRISATVPTAKQIAKIYNDEKNLFTTNAQATLYGTSDSVTALAYDDDTNLLHVGTSAGRSVFQGLNRVDNTTDAVGAAISASNGLVAED